MIELTFHNTKHHTRTKSRVPTEGTLNRRQLKRIENDLCHKGCCADAISHAVDLDGMVWVLTAGGMRRKT